MRLHKFPVFLALGLSTVSAQQVLRKEPFQYAGPDRASRVEARPPGMRLGLRKPREFALAPLSESEAARLTGPNTRLKKTGVQRALAPHSYSVGKWEVTAEGTRLWRMAVRSPGAHGMRVELDNFSVGEGKVWLHDGNTFAGPYTGKGMYDDGHFFTGAVYSDSAILEYEPAPDWAEELEPPFEVRSIVHQVQSPLEATEGQIDPADYCELDVNCYAEWRPTMSTVGQISFVSDGVEALCSGSLLATRDNSGKPYFLTAGHCIHDEAAARTVQTYWTYQTSTCGGAPPTTRSASLKSTAGAHLIAATDLAGGDYSLILLQDVPSGVTFSGWDPGELSAFGDVTGIHHPSGSWKRISFGERTSDATVNVEGTDAPADKYYQVVYSLGRVEHGSSGSPLFSSPGVIVASLSNGDVLGDGTVCKIKPQGAGYSRFSVTYEGVKDYLENLPADLVLPAKSTLAFTVSNHAASAGQAVQLNTQSVGNVTYKLRADAMWIQVSNITGSLSGRTPASVTISIDPKQLPQPGQFKSTVTIFAGAAPPQYITVGVTVAADQSNVVASITPNPIVQSGGAFSFQIRLAETGGAATRVTALKFNGADYTENIGAWFGTNRIPANGAIVAPISGVGRYPAGDQYFEFWGVDDNSGTTWYRTAIVVFR